MKKLYLLLSILTLSICQVFSQTVVKSKMLYSPPVENQGDLGWCSVYGLVHAAMSTALYPKYHNWEEARRSVAYVAMGGDEDPCDTDDGGINQGYIIDLINNKGVASWMTYPGTKPDCDKYPTRAQAVDAVQNKIRTRDINSRDLAAVKAELDKGNPIAVNILFGDSFKNMWKNGGKWTSYDGSDAGSGEFHMVCIVGYEEYADGSGRFKVQNSWGTSGGDNGFFWIPFSFVNVPSGQKSPISGMTAFETVASTASSQPVVKIYENIFHTGREAALPVGTFDNNSNVLIADLISSVKVTPGYVLEGYEHPYWSGKSIKISSDNVNLVNDNFNDIISSLVVRRDPNFRPAATLYSGPNYTGWSIQIPEGRLDGNYLGKFINFVNDQVSSIKFEPGYQATLYENGLLTGRTVFLQNDIPDLSTVNFNDMLSSIVVARGGYEDGPVFYKNQYYSGDRSPFNLKPGFYNYDHLNAWGIGNDQISSVKVPAGYRVTLFEHQSSYGKALVLTQDTPELFANSFNDITTSILVEKLSAPVPNVAKVFTDCNYVGKSVGLSVGNYNKNDLEAMGIDANQISSLWVNAGYKIELFSSANFFKNGIDSYRIYTSDAPCLFDSNFNDKTVSLRVSVYDPVAVFYEHCDYGGKSIGLEIPSGTNSAVIYLGNDNESKLAGIDKNMISSFKILKPGYAVTLYSVWNGTDYNSTKVSYTTSQSCLVSSNMNDKALVVSVDPSSSRPNARTIGVTIPAKIESFSNLQVYPNPVEASATVAVANGDKIKSISVIDLKGTVLNEYSIAVPTSSTSVDMRRLPSGMYILKIVSEKETVTKKIVKK